MTTTPRRWLAVTTRIVVAVLVLLVAMLIAWVLVEMAPKVEPSTSHLVHRRVLVFTPRALPVRRQWHGYGTAEPIDAAEVPARVTATVLEVPDDIDVGARVTAGQTLAKLDPTDFEYQLVAAEKTLAQTQAQIAQLAIEKDKLSQRLKLAQEDLVLAQRDLDRSVELEKSGAATANQIDQERRKVIAANLTQLTASEQLEKLAPRLEELTALAEAQQANVRQAKINLDRTHITSPLEGYLQRVRVEAGESVTQGQVIARVVNLRRMQVPVNLPAAARSDIGVGDAISLKAMSNAALTWSGKVVRIAPEDDAESRTVQVFVELDQTRAVAEHVEHPGASVLLPGMFVSAVATSGREQTRWLVPRGAMRDGRILTVADDTVVSRMVDVDFAVEGRWPQTGLEEDQWLVLTEPLDPTRPVVVSATPSIIDGQLIQPITERDTSAAASTDTESAP